MNAVNTCLSKYGKLGRMPDFPILASLSATWEKVFSRNKGRNGEHAISAFKLELAIWQGRRNLECLGGNWPPTHTHTDFGKDRSKICFMIMSPQTILRKKKTKKNGSTKLENLRDFAIFSILIYQCDVIISTISENYHYNLSNLSTI